MRHTRRIRSTIAAVALIVLSACGGSDDAPVASPDADMTEEPVDVPVDEPVAASAGDGDPSAIAAPGLVTPEQGLALAEIDSVVVLDVRTPAEYAEAHLDGTDLLLDFYSDTFADEIAALDPDADYFVYCRSGNRSGQTVALMRQLGFENVWDLDGGAVAWAEAGLQFVN